MYKKFIKRFLDITLSLIGLFAICPLLLVVWVVLSFTNCGVGTFFVQERPGKGGKLFKMIKFKTMNETKDSNNILLPPKKRITPTGKVLRSYSLDELPQLFNVLNGDMSLIGPRPLRKEYLPLYTEKQARRHNVRPGITGWAQINGRNSINWEEKFDLDVWYVDNLSFWLDVKILLITIWNVITRKGINQNDTSTMEPFNGVKLNG